MALKCGRVNSSPLKSLGDKKKKRSMNWLFQNSHGDGKHSIGNIVNNILKTVCGVGWALDLSG